MECPRCHNRNVKHFYQCHGETYCRECILFHRVFVNRERLTKHICFVRKHISYQLDFDLSSQQQRISNQLVLNYQQHLNSLVWAVCGSGKTEIVFELIKYVLSLGQRICFCIPRRELVAELYCRIQNAFSGVELGLVYGGCCQNPDAQFVICTMHQLYRYEGGFGFDLMIADEVDAFPFYQNEILNQMFDRCCLGNFVKLSATFSQEDIHDEQLLIMNRRYHGYDLPIPQLLKIPEALQKWMILYIFHKLKKKFIIYVPTLQLVESISLFLNKHHFQVGKVSSIEKDNQKTLQLLKDNQLDGLVSTTLLERGVTIEDIQVIVYQANHPLFDERTLIQIAGRVGRKPHHPTGNIYFLSRDKTKGIKGCIRTINHLNQMNA